MDHLPLEKLLQILQESDPEKGSDLVFNESKLDKFYKESSIREGVDRVPSYVIYYFYKHIYGGDMSKIDFFREFKKRFTQVRTGKQRYYLLEGSCFDLSREGLLEAAFYCKGKK